MIRSMTRYRKVSKQNWMIILRASNDFREHRSIQRNRLMFVNYVREDRDKYSLRSTFH